MGKKAQPQEIANKLAEFIDAAKFSLHIAIYDFRLQTPNLADPVIKALKAKALSGVKVRIAFDHGKPASQNVDNFISLGGDPAPKGTKGFLESTFEGTEVQIKSIAGSKLMHNKYVIRDVNTPQAALWTGSANFTDDAWTYQDNNILQISSPQLCSYYETDFQELWVSGNIKSTGVGDRGLSGIVFWIIAPSIISGLSMGIASQSIAKWYERESRRKLKVGCVSDSVTHRNRF